MSDLRPLLAYAAPYRGALAFAGLLMLLESATALAVPWLGGKLAGGSPGANQAIMLEYGRGVPKDLVKARALYEPACKAGAGLACDRIKVLDGHDGG